LGVTESQELVRGIAKDKSLPLAVTHALVARCDGVPLYLEEATRSILMSGYLREREFTWEAEGERLVVDIPSSIEAALVARFDAIGPARATLDLAAAIGREVSVPLLEAVSLDPPETVAAHLDAMVAFGLLQPMTDEPAEKRMRFKHALIRDAAYEAIPKRNRSALHARIAAVLRSRFPHWSQTQPELYALHLSGSGDHQAAIHYLQLAAQHAIREGALDEAVAHLEHGLQLLRSLPVQETTLRTELALQSSLATIHNARSWTNQALEDTCHRVIELAQRLDDAPAMSLARWGLWGVWLTRGRMPESMGAAQAMQTTLAGDPGDFTALAAPYASAVTALAAGNIELALASAQVPRDIDVGSMDRFIAGAIHVSPWVGIQLVRHCGHYIQGHFSRAAADWEEVERIAAGLSATPVAQGFATALGLTLQYMSGSLVDRAQRDPRALDEQLRKLIQFCREEGIGMWQSFAILIQAALDCHRGRIGGARQRVAEHIRLLESAGIRVWFVQFLTLHAGLCHLEGDYPRAIAVLDEAEAEARRSGQELGVCDLFRMRARVLASAGKLGRAMDALSEASAAAVRLGSPVFGLRCALDRHALSREAGDDDAGLALLRRAFEALPEPQADTPDLRTARTILSASALSGSSPHRSQGRA
jgi:tetratricopeptide (TPR) repeat protein